jgi:hypothetical protein
MFFIHTGIDPGPGEAETVILEKTPFMSIAILATIIGYAIPECTIAARR